MPYCGSCGVGYEAGGAKCVSCGSPLPLLYEEGIGPATGESVFGNPYSRRVVAGLIDLLVAYGLIGWGLVVLSRRFPVLRSVLPMGVLLVLLFPNPYLLLKDCVEGKSVGKLIAGIVAYNERERRPTGLFDSIIRNWYLAVPLIGPTVLVGVMGLQILVGRARRLGDAQANTVVITDFDYQRVR